MDIRDSSGGRGGGFKLFGVRIDLNKEVNGHELPEIEAAGIDELMRKSKSTGDLEAYGGESSAAVDVGYLSDVLVHERGKRKERNKGKPWTGEEHRSFLVGLTKQGKGNWKGISKNFVPSRTPTQVASHAQKYYMRLSSNNKKKRTSLFDIALKEPNHSPASPIEGTSECNSISKSNVVTSPVTSLKSNNDNQGQGSTSTTLANFEKPPLSPMSARSYDPNLHHQSCMVGIYGDDRRFPAAKVMPVVSFLPVMNISGQSYVYLPNGHGKFGAPFLVQASSSGGCLLRESDKTGKS